ASLEMARGAPGSAAAARSIRRAEALGAGLEGADQLAVLFLLARVRFVRGEMRTAWRMLQRIEPLIERSPDFYLRSAVHVQAGNILTCLGKLDAAEIEQQRAIEAYPRSPLRRIGAFAIDPLVSLLFCRAIIAWVRGRRAESRSAFAAAIADAESLSHPLSKAMIRLYWAPVALLEGDHALFTKLITEGQTTAVAIEASWLVRLADVFAPLADASLQPLDRARTMDAVLHDCEGSSFRLFRSLGLAVLAELLASVAQPDDAVGAMDEAMVEA